VEIHILQGERELANANRSLGKFELVGIPLAARGVPQIEVIFEVDANGIVNVSAKDKMTGLEQAMQVTPSSGLSPDEIDRLIMEAESSVETDKQTKLLILARNSLESLLNNTRNAMSEYGRGLPHNQQLEINGVLNEAETFLESDSLEAIRAAIEKVEGTASKLTEALMTGVS
jgi:molecular chaperone DnaK